MAGFQKFSLADFPGSVSAIVFTQGCNFRCPYCHNPELVDPAHFSPIIPEADVLEFLDLRKGQLQGIVVTGGEPTIQSDLPKFLSQARSLGYRIKLDTNGTNPSMLECLVQTGLLDYIAMDVKAPLTDYERVVRASIRVEDIRRSIEAIISSGVPNEFRTTYLESLLSPGEVEAIAEAVVGGDRFIIQPFTRSKTLEPRFLTQPVPSPQKLAEVRSHLLATGHGGLLPEPSIEPTAERILRPP